MSKKRDEIRKIPPQNPLFTKRFKQLFESSGCTVQAFAESIGISRQTIDHYLNAHKVPDAERLILISRALNVSTDYLLGLSEIPSPNIDMQAVYNDIGLNPDAVTYLKNDKQFNAHPVSLINLLLTSTEGKALLDSIERYLLCDYSDTYIMKLTDDGQFAGYEHALVFYKSIHGESSVFSFDSKQMEFSALESIKDRIRKLKYSLESDKKGRTNDTDG